MSGRPRVVLVLQLIYGTVNALWDAGMGKADYWKSQGRKFCDFCKCWIADNKPSIDFHEGGKKHKENVSKRLKEIHKNAAKQAKQSKKFENDIKKMENAAMAAYLKDVENNTRDMTADKLIKDKANRPDRGLIPNPNAPPAASTTTNPRFRNNQFPQEIDPCDPTSATLSRTKAVHQIRMGPGYQAGENNRAQGKSKAGKGKGKGKGRKAHEDDRPGKPVQKLWYEALSPEGYTYYWHVETNESVWEPPEEGYMTIAEQEEEAKEQALQAKLLEQLEEEEAIEKADILEEQRANAERERMKKLRQTKEAAGKDDEEEEEGEEGAAEGEDQTNEGKKDVKQKEERSYRRDYGVPVKPEPYGAWQVVERKEKKPVDLQLPEHKPVILPTFTKAAPQPPQRVFKEKTVANISTGYDGDDEPPAVFKKRRIGCKSVRKRMADD